MLIEAHRGDSANAPENTIVAFEYAINSDVPWLELDVQQSSDGSIVVIHDKSVDRTTNGSGLVSQMSLSELKKLDAGSWYNKKFKNQRIPLLSEVLALVTAKGTKISIEIKNSQDSSPIYKPLVEMLSMYDPDKRHVIISTQIEHLIAVRRFDPIQELGIVCSDLQTINSAHQERLSWVHAKHKILHASLVTQLHNSGIKCCGWTVNSLEDYLRMRLSGVDMICTDNPRIFMCLG